jgi:hypothetical protein
MSTFKAPDVTAPRFRPGRKNVVTVALLEDFRKKYPQYSEQSDETLKGILSAFHGKIWDTVIKERDGVELQSGIGYLFVGSYKSKRKVLDNKKSKELGKRVTHQNWETDGHSAKIFYSNYETKYKIKNRELWVFSGVRQFKRSVSEQYPANWKKYILVDNYFKTSALFKKATIKHIMTRNAEVHMVNYNEFKLD